MTNRNPPLGYHPFLVEHSWIGPFWLVATPVLDSTDGLLEGMLCSAPEDALEGFDYRFDPLGEHRRILRVYKVLDRDFATPRHAAIKDAWAHWERWREQLPVVDPYNLLPRGYTILIESHHSRRNNWLCRIDGRRVSGKCGGVSLRDAMLHYAPDAEEDLAKSRRGVEHERS